MYTCRLTPSLEVLSVDTLYSSDVLRCLIDTWVYQSSNRSSLYLEEKGIWLEEKCTKARGHSGETNKRLGGRTCDMPNIEDIWKDYWGICCVVPKSIA